MRTTLDGVEGELFEEARSWPKENMKWDIMADRLGKDPTRRRLLLNQGSIRTRLYEHLSDIAKRRPKPNTPALDALWTTWLDHLLIVAT
jgi:hypothetical protein